MKAPRVVTDLPLNVVYEGVKRAAQRGEAYQLARCCGCNKVILAAVPNMVSTYLKCIGCGATTDTRLWGSGWTELYQFRKDNTNATQVSR